VSSDVEQQIRSDRIAKVEAMRQAGVDPYPARTPARVETDEVRAQFGELEAGAESGQALWVAGRISGRRGHGKAIFLDLTDRTGQLQLHATLDVLGEDGLAAVGDCDLGDVVAVHGEVFSSRRGELSLRVDEWRPLAKCLRPLPEKHHGLADVEQRYRQRYLDLLVNDEARRIALARPAIVTAARGVLDTAGFVEVETPVLQPLYGGGMATPFVTRYEEYERDFYLRIADELYLKRLIVGGLERVYELSKDFRNEGVSFKRNPEFTMLEWYEAYTDYEGGMDRTEQVVAAAAKASGSALDLTPPWPRVRLRDAIAERAGIDPMADRDRDRLVAFMRERDLDTSGDATWAQAVDHLLSHFVEPKLEQPTFIVDYPIELSPFAKRSPADPAVVERFEAFCSGMEIANGYSELNDPAEQRARFEEARAAAAAGDAEAHPMDEDFLLALEYGMPPTAGVGIGIDRLAMVLTGVRSIREVILFPTLRDRETPNPGP
jgi:lysyl-tRNA synthetase class 2